MIYSYQKNIQIYLNSINSSKNRIFKIQYSPGLKSIMNSECMILKARYNVLSLDDLLNPKDKKHLHNKISSIQEYFLGLFKNIIGLIPGVGSYFTGIIIVADLVGYNIKKSEVSILMNKLNVKNKPKKNYKNIENIILIPDSSVLNKNEISYLIFLSNLINLKYIFRTAILICEPKDCLCAISVAKSTTFNFELNNDLLSDCLDSTQLPNESLLKLIDIVGIEYIDDLKILIQNNSNDRKIVESLINKMLEKLDNTDMQNINTFLKLCSFLFDKFTIEDISMVSDFKNFDTQDMIEKSLDATIFQHPNENQKQSYSFLHSFIKDYYQNNNQTFSTDTYNNIFNYLKDKYSEQYTNIALISKFMISNDDEIKSLYIIAYYQEQLIIPTYKMEKLKAYLEEFELGKLVLELDKMYEEISYINEGNSISKSYKFLDMLKASNLTTEAKLAAFSFPSRILYELEYDQKKLIQIADIYKTLLGKINLFTNISKEHYEYVLDYIIFSTCIEIDYSTKNFVQKLIIDFNTTDKKYLKLLRLGNVIYPTNAEKGMQLTKKAYELSHDFIGENQLATINYSCSLITCGIYEEATKILLKNNYVKPSIYFSAYNNLYVASFFLNAQKNKQSNLANLQALYNKSYKEKSSDMMIIHNNYVSACIVAGKLNQIEELVEKCNEIILLGDIYHSFYAYQNLLSLYFFTQKCWLSHQTLDFTAHS